ncbi:MAG: DUF502 domain-containing protein [Bacteroidales bacterium]
MKKLLAYLGQGLLIVAPLVITGYILFQVFNLLDGILKDQITRIVGFSIPGLGFILVIIFLVFLGWIGQTLIGRPFRRFFNSVINKAPALKTIYSALNDLFKALVGNEKKFDSPVVALINKENNLWKMGFITQESMESIGLPGLVTVYMPHSFNFSGEHFILPAENVRLLDIQSGEAMKFIVSGGVANYEQD